MTGTGAWREGSRWQAASSRCTAREREDSARLLLRVSDPLVASLGYPPCHPTILAFLAFPLPVPTLTTPAFLFVYGIGFDDDPNIDERRECV